MTKRRFQALVFDKDGTLIDFHGSWDEPIVWLVDELAAKGAERHAVARILGLDLDSCRLSEDSPVLAESTAQIADRLALACGRIRGDHDFAAELDEMLSPRLAASATPAPEAAETLHELDRRGVAMAVATNDATASARRQMEALGWIDLFDAIVGYDAVQRAKPEPDMVRLAVSRLGAEHIEVAMVGDTTTDVQAAQRAGVTAIAVGAAAADTGADVAIASLSELLDLV